MIQILCYNYSLNQLTIAFEKKRTYTYLNVSPYFYRQIDISIIKSNYSKASKILKQFKTEEN